MGTTAGGTGQLLGVEGNRLRRGDAYCNRCVPAAAQERRAETRGRSADRRSTQRLAGGRASAAGGADQRALRGRAYACLVARRGDADRGLRRRAARVTTRE